MKHLISFTFFFLFASLSNAQNINVKSFRLLENDLDARVNHPKRDQNNEVCAIIKVVTTQTGFTFDVGSLGVVVTEQKAGEIWVYVPRGVQRITISHSQLGVLRNHPLNIPIQAAMVYELVLTTAKVTTTVEEPEIESQWLIITSNPEGANVFIDDMLVGTTPFQRRYREGDYNYRVELPRYHNQAGRISLKGDRQRIDLTLKPNFGDIRVTSTPENGMAIYLNDNNTGKTTPATIEGVASGENTVKLIDSWYQPQAKRVTVNDEKTTTVSFQMQPAFANVTINAKPSANILIDDVQKGNTRWNGRLMEGVYSIRIEKDKHYPQTRKLEIISGKDQSFDFELKPKTGAVNISTIPIDANISIDDKNYGKTPLTIKDLLVGDYNLSIDKTGYGSINRKITITENKELDIKETLPTGLEVTFETTPSGAELYINGKYQGKTPQNISLEYGNHNVKLVNNSRVIEEIININQNSKNKWIFDVIDGKEVNFTSFPVNSTLRIDGIYTGTTPKKVFIAFGVHKVSIEHSGKKIDKTITVNSNSNPNDFTKLFDCFEEKLITSNVSKANVFINGKRIGNTPIFFELKENKVKIEVRAKGYHKTSKEVFCDTKNTYFLLTPKNTLSDFYNSLTYDRFSFGVPVRILIPLFGESIGLNTGIFANMRLNNHFFIKNELSLSYAAISSFKAAYLAYEPSLIFFWSRSGNGFFELGYNVNTLILNRNYGLKNSIKGIGASIGWIFPWGNLSEKDGALMFSYNKYDSSFLTYPNPNTDRELLITFYISFSTFCKGRY